MDALPLLLLCFSTSCFIAPGCALQDGVSCFSDYWYTISCVLKTTEDPGEAKNTSRWLNFTKINHPSPGPFLCRFEGRGEYTRCQFSTRNKLSPAKGHFASWHKFHVQSCNASGCRGKTQFKPSEHIRTTPPKDVRVHSSSESFNITWTSGYENHTYIKPRKLSYNLTLQRPQGPSNEYFPEIKSISINRSPSDPSGKYCIRVKSKYEYAVGWSEWSPLVCWQEDLSQSGTSVTTHILVAVCVCAVILIGLSTSAPRLKVRSLLHVPSPAPYFDPLFHQYGGNLQEWLSSPGAYLLRSDMEDMVSARCITVEPKAPHREEENVHAVQHLPPNHDQMSYILAPGVAWTTAAPAATHATAATQVTAANSSYVPFPCAVAPHTSAT